MIASSCENKFHSNDDSLLDFLHDEYKYLYLFSCLKFNETNIKTLKTFLLLIACNYYQIISQQSSSYLCYWTDKSNQIAKVKY